MRIRVIEWVRNGNGRVGVGRDLRRDIVGGRDGVTPVAFLDGICPGAVRGEHSCIKSDIISKGDIDAKRSN